MTLSAGPGRARLVMWLFSVLLLAGCNLNAAPENAPLAVSGAPVVQIIAPLPNATFMAGVPVNIQARVSNAGPDIDRVEFAVNDAGLTAVDNPNPNGTIAFSITQSWTAAGAGAQTITVTAFRADGSSSDPTAVTINVVGDDGSMPQPTTAPNNGDQPDTNPQPTSPPDTPDSGADDPAPTTPPEPAATATPSVPVATFNTGVNVRSGPGLVFNPPIGSFAANDTSEVLAVSPDRSWYRVRYYNGDGWVFGNLLTVSGNVDSLPVDAGPPTPLPTVPPTATPIPATPTPQGNVNLVLGNWRTIPDQPECGNTFEIEMDIANLGTERYPGGGAISVVDVAPAGSTPTQGIIPAIEPGQTVKVRGIFLTVEINVGEGHTLRVTLDPNNQVAETNEGDNTGEKPYTLQSGAC